MSDTPVPLHGKRPLAEAEALRPGARISEFEILQMLGSGGFGIVYLAHDTSLQRRVALKEYLPAALAGRRPDGRIAVRSELFDEPFSAGLRSFINESRLLARFDHPSLVKVHRFWEANGTAYMVMPFYEGVTLKQVRQSMTVPPDEAWLRRILDALLGALEVMHGASVYHRDIAPDNILLLRSGVPVLLDFGAARHVLAEQTQTITAMLKPAYAPIEQYADALEFRQGPWTDIYATAATLHYCLTGKAPLTAIARTVHESYEPLHERLELRDPPEGQPYDAHWLAALDWALEIRPQERPQSIAQWKDALSGKVPAPRRDTTAQPLARASGRAMAIPEYYATAMTRQEYFPTTVAAALRRIPAANTPRTSTTTGAHALFAKAPATTLAPVTPIGVHAEGIVHAPARDDTEAAAADTENASPASPVTAQVVVLPTLAQAARAGDDDTSPSPSPKTLAPARGERLRRRASVMAQAANAGIAQARKAMADGFAEVIARQSGKAPDAPSGAEGARLSGTARLCGALRDNAGRAATRLKGEWADAAAAAGDLRRQVATATRRTIHRRGEVGAALRSRLTWPPRREMRWGGALLLAVIAAGGAVDLVTRSQPPPVASASVVSAATASALAAAALETENSEPQPASTLALATPDTVEGSTTGSSSPTVENAAAHATDGEDPAAWKRVDPLTSSPEPSAANVPTSPAGTISAFGVTEDGSATPSASSAPSAPSSTGEEVSGEPASSASTVTAGNTQRTANAPRREAAAASKPRSATTATASGRSSGDTGRTTTARANRAPAKPSATGSERRKGQLLASRSAGPDSPRDVCEGRVLLGWFSCMRNACDSKRWSRHGQCVEWHRMEQERVER